MATLATHTLLHPIVRETRAAGSEEIKEEVLKEAGFGVVLRRPKAKHLLAFDRHGDAMVAASQELLAKVSNLTAEEVAELDAEDFAELGNLLEGPKRSGPKTGATSSAG